MSSQKWLKITNRMGLVYHMLAKDSRERIGSARQVAANLEEIRQQL